jgi:starch phosphorylase
MAAKARGKAGAVLPHQEAARTGSSAEAIRRGVLDNLFYTLGRFPEVATPQEYYQALAYTVRDRLLHRWIRTAQAHQHERARTVCYLSAEFLLGPHLGNNLLNLGIYESAREALAGLGLHLDELLEQEEEPGLGNGGLGRLAACFMDSLATLQIPAIGYGIRYEFGIFDQRIQDGWQVEVTDRWLRWGNPWEIRRPGIGFGVQFGGRTEPYTDDAGRLRVRWLPERQVRGVAYDTPILGYGVDNANLLRLWGAEAQESFNLQAFNVGDYYGAVEENVFSENLTKVLYPNDEPAAGKRLRLEQEYFFVSCSLQDMLRLHLRAQGALADFHEKWAAQLNDTHPALGVAELMRLLVDEHGVEWEEAWHITRNTFAYTNHTLLPEALETWPLPLFAQVLPRHLEIIYEINRRFLDEVRLQHPGDDARLARMSLIDENGERRVRMANLACVGGHAVNGVAALHSELLRQTVLRDFFEQWPEKFRNVTNGVTPRRFVLLSNPALATLLTRSVGDGWPTDLERLRGLERLADDGGFQEEWRRVKRASKETLAARIRRDGGAEVDVDSLFDIQVKRIHEYKRQHLNVLHVVSLYQQIKHEPATDLVPRTVIFGGKAAPGYVMAKLIIKLINAVAEVVNGDPALAGRLRVVFLPDLNVKNAQPIYPAADLSEQISTAGMEASGTGNMKFTMNGALTIGTLDGANVEIRDAVGSENFFLFGLDAEAVMRSREQGYRPRAFYEADARLRSALDGIASGHFSHGDTELFRPLVDELLSRDEYRVLADFSAYVDCQAEVSRTYREPQRWTRMSILNTARSGMFSSDRSIREYAETIWRVKPMPIRVD